MIFRQLFDKNLSTYTYLLDQYHSLFEVLLKLPDNTRVYPAHDYTGWMVSSIIEEKHHNPRRQVTNAMEYKQNKHKIK